MPSPITVAHTVVRVAIGSLLFAHGAQKLFGFFGGGGPDGTAQFFESVGLKPGRPAAIASGIAEAGGGVALVLGLGTPAGAAAAAANMGVAAAQHAPNGLFNTKGGFELPATLGVVAASYLIAGPGPISLDSALGDVFNRPWMRVAAAAVAVPVAAYIVIRQLRERAITEPTGEGPGQDD